MPVHMEVGGYRHGLECDSGYVRALGPPNKLILYSIRCLSVFFGPHQAEMHPRPLSQKAIPHPFENRDGRVHYTPAEGSHLVSGDVGEVPTRSAGVRGFRSHTLGSRPNSLGNFSPAPSGAFSCPFVYSRPGEEAAPPAGTLGCAPYARQPSRRARP